MKTFKINGDFITISQLLKTQGYVISGGEVRSFLNEQTVLVNDVDVTEKRKKIFVGDIVTIQQEQFKMV